MRALFVNGPIPDMFLAESRVLGIVQPVLTNKACQDRLGIVEMKRPRAWLGKGEISMEEGVLES